MIIRYTKAEGVERARCAKVLADPNASVWAAKEARAALRRIEAAAKARADARQSDAVQNLSENSELVVAPQVVMPRVTGRNFAVERAGMFISALRSGGKWPTPEYFESVEQERNHRADRAKNSSPSEDLPVYTARTIPPPIEIPAEPAEDPTCRLCLIPQSICRCHRKSPVNIDSFVTALERCEGLMATKDGPVLIFEGVRFTGSVKWNPARQGYQAVVLSRDGVKDDSDICNVDIRRVRRELLGMDPPVRFSKPELSV